MVLFFPLNLVYLRGLGGWCIPTLFVAATDGPRNDPSPFGFNCTIEASSINSREIGRAPLFCRLLLPLSDIPQICQDSNPQRATQQKSKRLSFQFIFRRAKLDARYSPYPIFKPFNPKKKRKKPFCALSQTFFLSALFYSVSRSLLPYISWSLYISLRSVDPREKNRGRKRCCLAE